MAVLYDTNHKLRERAATCLADDFKHNAIETAQETFYNKRGALVRAVPEWQDLRACAAAIREQVTQNLDYYVAEFVRNAQAQGARVHLAPTGEDALCAVLDIFEEHNAASCVKSKSMMTEEIGLNETLEEASIKVVETDCAENILQTAGDRPSHIVVPALHHNRDAIAEIYRSKGYTGSNVPEEITHFLRSYLRTEFLTADIGIRGCNFAVAETGSVTLVTNEGNGRMVDTCPPVQIVFVGIDRIVPTLESLDVMMALLPRSAVGAKITTYFSVDQGARRTDELDGPATVHYIVMDNGRSSLLGTDFQPMLRCIRCGACLNICPVYRHITGHGYGSIYPGPMGVVMTCCLEGYDNVDSLPMACTLCAACDDDCPMEVPLHSLIRKHRIQKVQQGKASKAEAPLFATVSAVLSDSTAYRMVMPAGRFGMKALARSGVVGKSIEATREKRKLDVVIPAGGVLSDNTTWVPILKNWTSCRNMDLMAPQLFRDWFYETHDTCACGCACDGEHGESGEHGVRGEDGSAVGDTVAAGTPQDIAEAAAAIARRAAGSIGAVLQNVTPQEGGQK